MRFSPQVEIQLIRILHEALTNIIKHAQARRAKISITTSSDKAMITIEDDGQGVFLNHHPVGNLHFGLETMKQRARSAGGKFAVSSVPGCGTKLLIELPLAQQ